MGRKHKQLSYNSAGDVGQSQSRSQATAQHSPFSILQVIKSWVYRSGNEASTKRDYIHNFTPHLLSLSTSIYNAPSPQYLMVLNSQLVSVIHCHGI